MPLRRLSAQALLRQAPGVALRQDTVAGKRLR
jgi:hypothetical protein